MQVYKLRKKRILTAISLVATLTIVLSAVSSPYIGPWASRAVVHPPEPPKEEIHELSQLAKRVRQRIFHQPKQPAKHHLYSKFAGFLERKGNDKAISYEDNLKENVDTPEVGVLGRLEDKAYYAYEEDDDDENHNPVFKDGDFDVVQDGKMANGVHNTSVCDNNCTNDAAAQERRITQHVPSSRFQVNVEDSEVMGVEDDRDWPTFDRLEDIVDGVFWSEKLEAFAGKGFDNESFPCFVNSVRKLSILKMEAPKWNRCGRPNNQYLTMSDGKPMCARYRSPHHYLIQGEVLSFYLSRLLGIENVPAVVLSKVSLQDPSWGKYLTSQNLQLANWRSGVIVALIQWIEKLSRCPIPSIILKALSSKIAINGSDTSLLTVPTEDLLILMQWTDLIIFDYITGNYDRVASMQDAAEKEQRPNILNETVHNLVYSHAASTRGLWLIDNESGLLDAYSLLYSNSSSQGKRFQLFHKQMLETICIFRRQTWERVRMLMNQGSQVLRLLLNYASRHEPLIYELPNVYTHKELAANFHRRIHEVYRWMQTCESAGRIQKVESEMNNA